MTKIIKSGNISSIKKAAQIIKAGGLVVFPTETVYGIGANALDPKAVNRIFKAKGRPSDNPLIVHIDKMDWISKLCVDVPGMAYKLAYRYWPGPLTLVLKKSSVVPKNVTAGLDTVAVRIPNNKIALSLIRESKVPIAAPSANLSGKPSPTKAIHIIKHLDKRVDIIIDGGPTDIGLESTVLDLASKIPTILRPGKISLEELRMIMPNVKMAHPKSKIKSPGMKYRHYSPESKVILSSPEKIPMLIKRHANDKIAVIHTSKVKIPKNIESFYCKNLEILAHNIFDKFHEYDSKNFDLIIIESVEEKRIGTAIMDRLKKAASEIVN